MLQWANIHTLETNENIEGLHKETRPQKIYRKKNLMEQTIMEIKYSVGRFNSRIKGATC